MRNFIPTIRTAIALTAICAVAAFAAPAAFAVTPVVDQYGNPTAVAGEQDAPAVKTVATTQAAAHGLPMTGGEFAYLLIGAGLLGGSAYALRRASRPDDEASSPRS